MVDRLTYFAPDGNFGDAAGITIIDTSAWAESDFEFVKTFADGRDLPQLARLMSEWISQEIDPEEAVEVFEKLFGITEDQLRDHYGDL